MAKNLIRQSNSVYQGRSFTSLQMFHTHTYTRTFNHSTFRHNSITHIHPTFTHLSHTPFTNNTFTRNSFAHLTSICISCTHRSSTISCLLPALPIPSMQLAARTKPFVPETVKQWTGFNTTNMKNVACFNYIGTIVILQCLNQTRRFNQIIVIGVVVNTLQRHQTRQAATLYLCMYTSLYLCISVSLYLSIYLSIYLPIYLPTYLSLYLCIYTSTYLCFCVSLYPCTYVHKT